MAHFSNTLDILSTFFASRDWSNIICKYIGAVYMVFQLIHMIFWKKKDFRLFIIS